MIKSRRNQIALSYFLEKMLERKLGDVMILDVDVVSLRIGESSSDVRKFFDMIIGTIVERCTGLSVKNFPDMNSERVEEIAYKLLCSHAKREGIRLSGNIHREVGSMAKKTGISTDEGIEFLQEIMKDAFFSKNAD